MKKLLSIFVVLALVIGLMPIGVLAGTSDGPVVEDVVQDEPSEAFKIIPQTKDFTISKAGKQDITAKFKTMNYMSDWPELLEVFSYSGGTLTSGNNKIEFFATSAQDKTSTAATIEKVIVEGTNDLALDTPIYVKDYSKAAAGTYTGKLKISWKPQEEMDIPDGESEFAGSAEITLKISIPTQKKDNKKENKKDNKKDNKKKSKKTYTGVLLTKLTASGKKGIKFSWGRIKGVGGYDVFLSRCNHNGKKMKPKKIKTFKGNKRFTWTKSGLKKNTSYKAFVKAWIKKNGKKKYVKTGPKSHIFTGNVSKGFTNPKSVTVKKKSISLRVNKTAKIKANATKEMKGKRFMPKRHEPRIRFASSNKSIATVNGSGKIKGIKAGTCYVYAFAPNGVSMKIKVGVKF